MKKTESKNNRKILVFVLIIAVVAIVLIANKGRIFNQEKYKRESNRKVPITPEDLVPTEHANIEQDSTGTNVPVPKGYVGSPLTTGFTFNYTDGSGSTTISDGGENTINTGFVIYEKLEGESDSQAKANILADPWTAQCTRNQFVWVPVPDPSTIYGTDSNGKKWGKLYDFRALNEDNITKTAPLNWSESGGVMTITNHKFEREPDIAKRYDIESKLVALNFEAKNSHDFLIQLEREFEESIESIEKYGGFYIGRYETGGLSGEAKIVKEDTDIGNQAGYTMYSKLKKLERSNRNVITSMIWGSQLDRTLMWLGESGNKTKKQIVTDSRDWANYQYTSFSYIKTTGTILTKSANVSVIIPSGSSEYTRANNIYDLAGNVAEETKEVYSANDGLRINRGGTYNSTATNTAAFRNYSNPTTSAAAGGSRAALYVK